MGNEEDQRHRGRRPTKWRVENKRCAKADSRIFVGKANEETGRTGGGVQKSGASKMQGSFAKADSGISLEEREIRRAEPGAVSEKVGRRK